jgi:diadenosine tetraphosphate (Ap4A) HIT family hydrolase
MSDNKCVFCVDNWPNLEILADLTNAEGHRVAVLRPLDPVTDGHVLVIGALHTKTAATDPRITGQLMVTAAWWVQQLKIEANIITSIGSAATQTVMHTHVHVVPRKVGDGLPLPWTPQHERKKLAVAEALMISNRESSYGMFQQQSNGWLGDGGPLCGQAE